jgi:uncharacterized protein YecT (DUF1311 family)
MSGYMMKFTKLILLTGIIFTTHTVEAGDELLTKEYSTCMGKAHGVTVTMFDCISKETALQDSKLNSTYKKLMTQLSTSRKKELLAAQRLWIQYRDANCRFYADPDGGTIARLNSVDCVLQATAARAKELENFFP